MGFWTGVAKGLEQDNERRFQEKQAEGNRAFQRELLSTKMTNDRQQMLLKARLDRENQFLEQGFRGIAGGSGGGSGSSSGAGGGVTLQALVTRFPQIDPETAAELAPYPGQVKEVYTALSELEESYANSGQLFPSEMVNNFIKDIVAEDTEPTPERVSEFLGLYGLSPTEELVPGITNEEMAQRALRRPPSATVITDPAALPAPMKPEQERLFRDTVGGQLEGFLRNEEGLARAEFQRLTEESKVRALTDEEQTTADRYLAEAQKAGALAGQVEKGFTDAALSSEYGTQILQSMWDSGNRVNYRRIYPSFTPHFATDEQATSAAKSGFIQPGQPIRINGQLMTF